MNKRIRGLIIAPVVLIVGLLYGRFFVSGKSPTVSINDKAITISTQYGTTIDFSDINDIKEKDSAPAVLSKIYGYNDGTTLRGEFQSNGNTVMLFINVSQPPFIYITTRTGLVVVNEQTSAETQSLYKQLRSKIGQP
ncbi:MAG: hypothetical protein ABF449_09415 [Ethanoligenens sp.]